MCPCGGVLVEVERGGFWRCPFCDTLYLEPPDLAANLYRETRTCELCGYHDVAGACPAGDHCARCCPPECVA